VTTNEIIHSILDGDNDGEFDEIIQAIKVRRKSMDAGKVLGLRVGDRVRFNSRTRPQYLVGVEGEVVKKNQTSVTVKPDEALGRFSGDPIRCPVGLVDKIEA
jgi:hypothetical protein